MFITFYDQEDYPITINPDSIESVVWGSEEKDPTQIYSRSGRSYYISHTDKRNHPLLAFIGGEDWIKLTEAE